MTSIEHHQGYKTPFDQIRHVDGTGAEYWSARELMAHFGYARWAHVRDGIGRAKSAISNSFGETAAQDHIDPGVHMIETGKGATRQVDDFRLTRYGAYMWAMNGDPRKLEIASAQTYFAVRTREAETSVEALSLPSRRDLAQMVIDAEDRIVEVERKHAEDKPYADAYKHLMDAEGGITMLAAAKTLGTGRTRLFQYLRENGVLISVGRDSNLPYQNHINLGRFLVRVSAVDKGSRGIQTYSQTFLTPKGMGYVSRMMRARSVNP